MILNDDMPVRKDPGDSSLLLLASIRDPMIDIQCFNPSDKGEINIFPLIQRIMAYVSEYTQSPKTVKSLAK